MGPLPAVSSCAAVNTVDSHKGSVVRLGYHCLLIMDEWWMTLDLDQYMERTSIDMFFFPPEWFIAVLQ